MVEFLCPKCHYIGKPKKKKRGSGRIELYGWLLFPLGVPYSLWRMLSKISVCPYCDETYLVALDSPVGKRILDAMDDGYDPMHKQASTATPSPDTPVTEKPLPKPEPEETPPARPPRPSQDDGEW